MNIRIRDLLLLFCLLTLSPAPGAAEQALTSTLTQPQLEALIEQAHEKGVEVVIVSPGGAAAPAKAPAVPMAGAQAQASAFRAELQVLIHHLPNILPDAHAALSAASPSGAPGYFLWVIAGLIAVMLAAASVEWFYGRWVKERMRAAWPEAPDGLPGKMTFLAVRFLVRLLGFAFFGLISLTLAALFYDNQPAVEATVLTVLITVVAIRVIIEFWRVWIAPNLSGFRLPDLDDEAASRLFAWLTTSATLSGGAAVDLPVDGSPGDRRA